MTQMTNREKDESSPDDSAADAAEISTPRGKSARKPRITVDEPETPATPETSATSESPEITDPEAESAQPPAPARESKPAAAQSSKKKGLTLTITAGGLLRAAAVLVVVAVLAVAGFLGWKAYDQHQRMQAFDDSIAASKHFINELVASMPANTADQYKDRLGPLSTGDFKKTLERERTDTEQQVRDIRVTSASADIKLATVEQFTTDSATTLLQVEVTATGATSPAPQKATFFYLISLQKENGKWLVAKLGPAPGTGVLFGDGQQVAPGAQTTTPAAPGG